MGQARLRRKALEAGTAAPEERFRGTYLLGRNGMWVEDDVPAQPAKLVTLLKLAHDEGYGLPDLARRWAAVLVEDIDDTLDGQSGYEIDLFDPSDADDRRMAEELKVRLLERAGDIEDDLEPVDDFVIESCLHCCWHPECFRGAAHENYRLLLEEIDRLMCNEAGLSLRDLAKAVAIRFGADFDGPAVLSDPMPVDLPDSGEQPLSTVFPPTEEQVRVCADTFVENARRWSGLRDLVQVDRNALMQAAELCESAAEEMRRWALDYLEQPRDAGARALAEVRQSVTRSALELVAGWDGAEVQDLAPSLELVFWLEVLEEVEESALDGLKGRMMIGPAAVWDHVIADEPKFIFQDVDGDLVLWIDDEVVVLPFDPSITTAAEGRRMRKARRLAWEALAGRLKSEVGSYASRHGGAGAWIGDEVGLARKACPDVALLMDGSRQFGRYAVRELHRSVRTTALN